MTDPGQTSPRERLQVLGISIPVLPPPQFSYVPGVAASGPLLFVSGQTPTVEGKPAVTGRCGERVSVEQGQLAARLAAINLLGEIEATVGLDRVGRIVKVTGYVAAADGFLQHPAVVEGASQLMVDVFGESGRHARVAIGVAWLPGNAPVEVELIAQLSSIA